MLSSISYNLRYFFATVAMVAVAQVSWTQQTYTISIIAGGGSAAPGDGGTATSVSLYSPVGVVEDGAGNIYFAESGNYVIRKVTPSGIISTIAGQYGSAGFSGDGGPATSAKLNNPEGIAFDAAGNLYIADTLNVRIRKISTDGVITTVAGGGNPPCCGNIGDGGPATAAVLANPEGVAIDSDGSLYISEPDFGRVRKVDGDGIITTVAGGSAHGPGIGDGGAAVNATFVPHGIALDAAHDLYIADAENSRIRVVATNGIISTFAGSASGYSGDGGPATSAELFAPFGVALDAFGDVYIADHGNSNVRAVSTNGIISTIAGGACCALYNGQPATGAWIPTPWGITAGTGGKLYLTEGAFVLGLIPGTLTATSTSLTADENPQNLGAKVTFTSIVQPMSGSGTPTGSIKFAVDGTSVATVPLDTSGHASYATSSLTAGTHTITAAYSGDVSYSTSSATLMETIVETVSVTFGTAPAGLAYIVDAVSYVSPQIFSFLSNSQHTVSVTSPQTSSGTLNTFANWSDGGAQSHTITITSSAGAASYIATFKTSYLLTTAASPASGGAVSPVSGTYYPEGAVVQLTAAPQNGYTFTGWTGNVASDSRASTTVTMRAPQSVTASFGPSGATSLSGNIVAKAGPGSARVWSVQINNSGPSAGVAAQISGIFLAQAGGAACTPVISSAPPVAAGNMAPDASVIVPLTIDFSGCAANARFTVSIGLSANNGTASGSIVRLNQFQ